RIFHYACTDDGTTGRSLSLVSKYIHDTSEPYKLQSISISGADNAARFVLALRRTPPQHRRVTHLHISNDATVQPILAPHDSGQPSSPIVRATTRAVEVIPGVRWYKKYKCLKENVDHNVRCMQTNRHRDESIFTAFLQILHFTAPTLRTLNVNFESRWKIIPAHVNAGLDFVPIRSLPLLTSLTVRYYALFHSEVDESLFVDNQGEDGMALLPQLRYLDLEGFRIRSHPFDLYEWIGRVAPGLMFLRLPMRMVNGLAAALGRGLSGGEQTAEYQVHGDSVKPRANSDRSNTHPILLPPSLRRVYIQLSPPPTACCVTFPLEQEQGAYLSAVEELRALERRDERVVVVAFDFDWECANRVAGGTGHA
ncbi:hypothetical protein PILCRDRAFT_9377, partial [Piloderma croceum F 1598]